MVLEFDNKVVCYATIISVKPKNKSMWDKVFNICVDIMSYLADLTGLTYNQINVLVFCVLWPLHTIYLFALSYRARKALLKLKYPNSKPRVLPLIFPTLRFLLKILHKLAI